MCKPNPRRVTAQEREEDTYPSMTKDKFTAKYLSECFDYIDGKLFWKFRGQHHFEDSFRMNLFNSRFPGKEAGAITKGYRMIGSKLWRIGTHRVVFLIHHGYLPEEVDHINGDSYDNRIENLRPATHQQNATNMKTSTANTSGRKGVFKLKGRERWVAFVRSAGKNRFSPRFKSFDEACEFRELIEKMTYGEFANER